MLYFVCIFSNGYHAFTTGSNGLGNSVGELSLQWYIVMFLYFVLSWFSMQGAVIPINNARHRCWHFKGMAMECSRESLFSKMFYTMYISCSLSVINESHQCMKLAMYCGRNSIKITGNYDCAHSYSSWEFTTLTWTFGVHDITEISKKGIIKLYCSFLL